MIEAFRLSAACRGETLWEGLDLSFREGELWLLTGPPSAGKSVLLQILRGARLPDAGDVVVSGESIYRGKRGVASAFRAVSGVVHEAPLAGLEKGGAPMRAGGGGGGPTVGDLFRLSAMAAPGRITADERRSREEELMALLGMARAGTSEAGQPPAARDDPRSRCLASLSLSERARAALAAELLRGPRYLFADMLLAHVGKEWADTVGALLRALAREGTTVVLAERAAPERWPGLSPAEPPAAGPFLLFRSGGAISGGAPPWGEDPAVTRDGAIAAPGGEGAPEAEAPPPPDDEGDEAG